MKVSILKDLKVSILLDLREYILKDLRADILWHMDPEENLPILKLLQKAQHIPELILRDLQEYILRDLQQYILRALKQHIQVNILEFILINIQARQFLLSWNKMIILSGKE